MKDPLSTNIKSVLDTLTTFQMGIPRALEDWASLVRPNIVDAMRLFAPQEGTHIDPDNRPLRTRIYSRQVGDGTSTDVQVYTDAGTWVYTYIRGTDTQGLGSTEWVRDNGAKRFAQVSQPRTHPFPELGWNDARRYVQRALTNRLLKGLST